MHTIPYTIRYIFIVILIAGLCNISTAKIIYVDGDATGSNDGSSWKNAYLCLQDALGDAQSGDEIQVAEGIYKPDQYVVTVRSPYIASSGDRNATFQLKNGVTIRGGYAGLNEPDPNIQNIEFYETILSGDLNDDDGPYFTNNSENSYHVVTGSGTDGTAVLDGVTVRGGNADGEYPFNEGGGLYNELGNPTLNHCRFIGNSSIGGGGGIRNESSSPSFSYCDFEGNSSDGSGGGMGNINGSAPILKYCTFTANSAGPCGGALENEINSYANLQNCTFIGNSAGGGGGAIENTESGQVTTSIIGCTFIENRTSDLGGGVLTDRSHCIIVNSLFVENRAIGDRGWGGALYAEEATVTVVNCTFTGNSAELGAGMVNYNSNSTLNTCTFSNNRAELMGGGMYNCEQSSPTLTNCTFSENFAGGGGGGGMYNEDSIPTLIDCVFTSNSATGSGGGMYNNSSDSVLLRCLFSTNSAERRSGGGMYNRYTSQPSLTNCIFNANSARRGGGIENLNTSHPLIFNCTFSANIAEDAGGGISNIQDSKLTMINCILWDNTAPNGAQIYDEQGSSTTVSYSNIQLDGRSPWPGEGNINKDPLFADPDNDDFHLKSNAGRWDPNSYSWVLDDVNSPCIDAGDPNSPICYEPIPNGGFINMGAYGGMSEASLSPLWPLPDLPDKAFNPIPADGAVDEILDVILRWESNTSAVAHEIYFGTSELPPFVQRQYDTVFDPGALEPNTQYYWRIDDIDNMVNRATGDIWTFLTGNPPAYAYNPIPAHDAIDVSANVILSWDSGLDAIAHDVYFGTDFNNVNEATIGNPLGVLVSGGQNSNSYNPGPLVYNQTYFWRIDEVAAPPESTTTKGNVWSFLTTGGGRKGRACFTDQTGVWIDSKLVSFSSVIEEQRIRGINGPNRIEEVQKHEGTFACYDVLLESGYSITVAENHFFMTESGQWIALQDLKTGTSLKTAKGTVVITSVTKRPEPYVGNVYNLNIKDSDCYLVGQDAIVVRDY